MRNKTTTTAGLVGAIALAAALSAQGAGGAKTLTTADYAEIQRLYAYFNWALDTHADNGMAYAKTFTLDGEFVYGTNKTVGRDKLAQLGARNAQQNPAPHHYATNIIIASTPEGARGSAYVLLTNPGEPNKPAALSTGTYDDVLVKRAEGWRFKHRELFIATLPPSATAAALLDSK